MDQSNLIPNRSAEAKERGAAAMEEEEHEVYGGEIPDVADMDADVDMSNPGDTDIKVLLSLRRSSSP